MRPGLEADHLIVSTSEVKNEGSCASTTLYAFTACAGRVRFSFRVYIYESRRFSISVALFSLSFSLLKKEYVYDRPFYTLVSTISSLTHLRLQFVVVKHGVICFVPHRGDTVSPRAQCVSEGTLCLRGHTVSPL